MLILFKSCVFKLNIHEFKRPRTCPLSSNHEIPRPRNSNKVIFYSKHVLHLPSMVMTHFWLSQTLAVLSQDPLSRVPNLPAAREHTATQ